MTLVTLANSDLENKSPDRISDIDYVSGDDRLEGEYECSDGNV